MQMIRISEQAHITRFWRLKALFKDFDDFKFGNWVSFSKKRSVMSRRKQRSAFDQVSSSTEEGYWPTEIIRIIFQEIGSRVGRNKTTVMPGYVTVGCMRVRRTDVKSRIHLQ
ncbi:hypothetical protein TNCV_2991181 [Trichonephila clavipes]|nr:hypothetical protein TNCV_2991181 [Trichonephila clavipes]